MAVNAAEEAIVKNPKWAKGYFRKGNALSSLKQYKAEEAYASAFALAPRDKSLMALISKMKKWQITSTTIKMKGFLSKKNNNDGSSLYADCEDVIVEEVDSNGVSKASKMHFRQLKRGLHSEGSKASFDGIFTKLLNPNESQKIIYPGISKDKLKHMPQTFEALLADPEYAAAMESLMPLVEAKANSVLENVKREAALVGEIMDEKTERTLLPQVVNEAFGRQVIAMVQRVSAATHVRLAPDSQPMGFSGYRVCDLEATRRWYHYAVIEPGKRIWNAR